MSAQTEPLVPGDRIRDFVLRGQDGTPMRFYGSFGGTPVVLFLYHSNTPNALGELVRLQEVLGRRMPGGATILAINNESHAANHQIASDHDLRIPVLSDTEGIVSSMYGIPQSEAMRIVILDSNLRVIATHDLKENETSAQPVEAALDSLPRFDPIMITAQAPVLLIPNVLDREFCEFLISTWHANGSLETGVERSREGRRDEELDEVMKSRRDHSVTDTTLLRRITSSVGRHVMPEVRHAFSFRATRFEGFKIAHYDSSTHGHFRPHRDNLSPTTAHRRFAMSLNLNEDYEGGYLRFPEYGSHLYRPEAGEAIVFSCSLLHEAMEVTEGQRFVLISFLFGEGDLRQSNPR